MLIQYYHFQVYKLLRNKSLTYSIWWILPTEVFMKAKDMWNIQWKKEIINPNYNLVAYCRNKDFLGMYTIIIHLFSIICLSSIYWFYTNSYFLCFLIFCIVYSFGVDIFLKLIHSLQNVKVRILTYLLKGYTLPRNGYSECWNVDSTLL